jgi:hypothetical protein
MLIFKRPWCLLELLVLAEASVQIVHVLITVHLIDANARTCKLTAKISQTISPPSGGMSRSRIYRGVVEVDIGGLPRGYW